MFISEFLQNNENKAVLALGYFDCLHIGHQKLLNTVKEMAKKLNVLSAVFTFSNNPGDLLHSKNQLINTFDERLDLFEQTGMDVTFYTHFNQRFMNLTAHEFLQMLLDKSIVGIACGFDYTFGKNSEGDCSMLENFCKENDIEFYRQQKVMFEGEKASTTLIKKFLREGELEKVKLCLGREYFMTGIVEHGYGIGADKLYPTANVNVRADKLFPKSGVYSGQIEISGVKHKAIINAGSRPTFNDDKDKIEVFVLDFKGNLYGKDVKVIFEKYIRGIKRFKSVSELKEQIGRDIEASKIDE